MESGESEMSVTKLQIRWLNQIHMKGFLYTVAGAFVKRILQQIEVWTTGKKWFSDWNNTTVFSNCDWFCCVCVVCLYACWRKRIMLGKHLREHNSIIENWTNKPKRESSKNLCAQKPNVRQWAKISCASENSSSTSTHKIYILKYATEKKPPHNRLFSLFQYI